MKERMPTIFANILGIAPPRREEPHKMAGKSAYPGMFDLPQTRRLLQKRMAALAYILREALSLSRKVHLVAEEAAPVARTFGKHFRRHEWVLSVGDQKRVPASNADVFIVPIALC
jgi:hypothetical protein